MTIRPQKPYKRNNLIPSKGEIHQTTLKISSFSQDKTIYDEDSGNYTSIPKRKRTTIPPTMTNSL